MKYLLYLLGIFICLQANAQTNADETAIKTVMQKQSEEWNKGNLKGFMDTYIKSDSLMFIGSKGITWGWDSTLARYQRKYPTQAERGVLTFDTMVMKKLSNDYYYVVGKFMLTRDAGDASGHFDLLFKKVNGKWLIISDHSS